MLLSNRKFHYQSSSSGNGSVDQSIVSKEERQTRLKSEIRDHVRYLADYSFLSPEWIRMVESLHQIANVAFLETNLGTATELENPLHQQGKKSSGTLWDSAKDELAVRILLEEGKLNLVLRLLHKFKQQQRENVTFALQLKTSSERTKIDILSLQEKCRVFEQSTGILLKFTLNHIEALQIIDTPELLIHCNEVLTTATTTANKTSNTTTNSNSSNSPPSVSLPPPPSSFSASTSASAVVVPLVNRLDNGLIDSEKNQEVLIFSYISNLFSHLDELDEDRILDLTAEYNLVNHLLIYLTKDYEQLSPSHIVSILTSLNAVFSSDAYLSDRSRFLSVTSSNLLIGLKEKYLNEFVKKGLIKRNLISSLYNEIAKQERGANKK